jgi:hypothetical protein
VTVAVRATPFAPLAGVVEVSVGGAVSGPDCNGNPLLFTRPALSVT